MIEIDDLIKIIQQSVEKIILDDDVCGEGCCQDYRFIINPLIMSELLLKLKDKSNGNKNIKLPSRK